MAIGGVNHTSFTVSSLDRSIAFYRDVLGLELVAHAFESPRSGRPARSTSWSSSSTSSRVESN